MSRRRRSTQHSRRQPADRSRGSWLTRKSRSSPWISRATSTPPSSAPWTRSSSGTWSRSSPGTTTNGATRAGSPISWRSSVSEWAQVPEPDASWRLRPVVISPTRTPGAQRMQKQTVRDFDPSGKRVLVRVDFNVPIEDGKVKDDSRIRAALPTIAYLLERGAAVVLLSHLGRPKGKVVESARLRPVAERLFALLRRPVPITGDPLGIGTRDAVARLKPGQVLMLENLRFHGEEEANDDEYAKTLASYGEVFV